MITLIPVQGGRRQRSGWAAATALVLAAGAGSAWVAQGDLDPTFNGDGKVTTAFFTEAHASASVYAVAVQPDGKIVAAGSASRGSGSEFALARYNADGGLDTSFSGDGKLTTDIFGGQDSAYAVAVQPDGKIVAVGSANINAASWINRFTLVRYNANGSLDTSFGTGAIVSTDFFGGDNIATSVALQADGRIVVVGTAHDGFGWRVALARYNANGSLDASFGTGGKETTSFFGFDDGASAVALAADGKIVVVGYAYPGGANNQFALARYNIDGSLDASFGTGGKVTTDFFGANDAGLAVVLQSDGAIVAAGLAYPAGSGTDQFALARYNADGSLDTTFSDDGKATAEFSEAYTRRLSAAGQADGKVVAVSWGVDGATGFDVFSLARFNTDGSLDPSFGANGKVTTNFLGSQNQAFAIAVQADGQIVAAGSAFDPSVLYSQFALARYDAGSGTAPAVTLSALAVNPSSVVGGTSSAGTVTLSAAAPSGGAVVSLSENSTSTSVPASVTVPSGATSANFTITTTSVTSATTSTISAVFGGVTRTAALTVNPSAPAPAAPTLASPANLATNVPQPVLLDWNNVTNATSYEVQVDNSSTIAAPLVANPTVTVSQATLAAGLPAQQLWWRVRARNAAGVFGPFSSTRRFTPQGTTAPASLSAVSVSPSSVTGGTGSTGTVTLTSGAPAGGAVVSLTSSNTAAVTVPASVTVAAGATTATFAATTSSVTATTPVTITASSAGVTRTATLTVNPQGQAATLTVTATGRSGERVTSTPAGINVNVGSTGSAGFNTGTAITLRVTNDRDAIWSGACSSGGNKTKTCTLTLNGNATVNANVQ